MTDTLSSLTKMYILSLKISNSQTLKILNQECQIRELLWYVKLSFFVYSNTEMQLGILIET